MVKVRGKVLQPFKLLILQILIIFPLSGCMVLRKDAEFAVSDVNGSIEHSLQERKGRSKQHRTREIYCNEGERYQPQATWLDWTKHGANLALSLYPGRDQLPSDMALPRSTAQEQLRAAYRHDDSITWFGHSTFLLRTGGKAILTDPVLAKHIGRPPIKVARLIPARPDWRSIQKLDAIIISHADYDHLSLTSLRMLHQHHPNLTLIVPVGTARYLPPLPGAKIREVHWHETVKLGAVQLSFVPAIHGTRRPPYRLNSALWGGYILASKGKKLYFSGDIAEGKTYKKTAKRYGPVDLAIVPIGGHDPQWFNRAYHATPAKSLAIAKTMGARKAIAMHWGTFPLSRESGKMQKREFLQAGEQLPNAPETILFKIGETRPLW